MIIASNSEIEVDGIPTLFSGFEAIITIKLTNSGTSQYVDVDYNSALGLPTTRYWFDADGEIVLPFGDLLRAMIVAGVSGASVQIMSVVDSATSTTLAVTCGVWYGIPPVVGDLRFPPRKCIAWGTPNNVPFASPNRSQTYDVYTSADGQTWTPQASVTTDVYGEAVVPMPTLSLGAEYTKVCASGQTDPLWQCRQMTEWCGSAMFAEWVSDSGKPKMWCFEVVSIDRETTDTRSTEGVGVMRGTFFPTEKNFTLKAVVRVSDLAVDETWYFDDFVTGAINGITLPEEYNSLSLLSFLSLSPWSAVVTDKKISRSATAQTTDLTFKLDLLKVRNF